MFTAEAQRRGGNYLSVSATSAVRYCGGSRPCTAVEQRDNDGFAVMFNRRDTETRRKLPPRLRALRGELLRRSRPFTTVTQNRGGKLTPRLRDLRGEILRR